MRYKLPLLPLGYFLFMVGFPLHASQLNVMDASGLPGVRVTTTRPSIPILVRNQYGPLMRVTVDLGKIDPADAFPRNDLDLLSVSFNLEGTDSLSDLESLVLLSSGEDEELRQYARFTSAQGRKEKTTINVLGETLPTKASFSFSTKLALAPGRNVFWLCGRLAPSADFKHHLKATCTRLETNAGPIIPKHVSGETRQRIGLSLRHHGEDGVDTYRIPVLATSATGTLLCAFDMRWRYPGLDLQSRITTGLTRSLDHGRTWETARVIFDMGTYGGLPAEQNGCSDPGLIVDKQTGDIFCFALWMHGKPGLHQWVGKGSEPGFEIGTTAQFLMIRSSDDGRTWSKPENLTRKLKKADWWLFAPSPNQGIQTSDGSLIMPVQGRDENGVEFSTIMTSHDHGENWTVGTPVPHPDSSECQAVELGDGTLMLNIRNGRMDASHHFRAVYVTQDFGKTWCEHGTNLNTLIEPECNASLLRFNYTLGTSKRHILLFSNPFSSDSALRSKQTIRVSFDDGVMWPLAYNQLLDEYQGFGYSSLTQIDDQTIGIVYEGSQADLVFQVLSLSDLLHPTGGHDLDKE